MHWKPFLFIYLLPLAPFLISTCICAHPIASVYYDKKKDIKLVYLIYVCKYSIATEQQKFDLIINLTVYKRHEHIIFIIIRLRTCWMHMIVLEWNILLLLIMLYITRYPYNRRGICPSYRFPVTGLLPSLVLQPVPGILWGDYPYTSRTVFRLHSCKLGRPGCRCNHV